VIRFDLPPIPSFPLKGGEERNKSFPSKGGRRIDKNFSHKGEGVEQRVFPVPVGRHRMELNVVAKIPIPLKAVNSKGY